MLYKLLGLVLFEMSAVLAVAGIYLLTVGVSAEMNSFSWIFVKIIGGAFVLVAPVMANAATNAINER